MRRTLAWVLAVLGVLAAVAGAAVMVVLGPDSRLTTGPHAIETDDIAVVTAPRVIRWADVQVDVLAEVPVRKPVFIGIANAVDVRDYVAKTKRLEITRFTRPWDVTTRAVDGQPNLPGAPTALDWWIDSDAGLGGASISAQLPDETVSIAILSVGSSNLSGLEVTLAYGVKGGFAKGAALLLLGVAALWVGVLLLRGAWSGDDEVGADDEEVVYVYIDEDGVEHEISAEEAAEMELVEEVVETGDAADVVEVEALAEPAPEPEPESEPEPEPTVPQVVVPGVLTAADFAAGAVPEDEKREPEPEPATDTERVVYVFVDEDGVEHEVGEDELAEFEVVDDEEDKT